MFTGWSDAWPKKECKSLNQSVQTFYYKNIVFLPYARVVSCQWFCGCLASSTRSCWRTPIAASSWAWWRNPPGGPPWWRNLSGISEGEFGVTRDIEKTYHCSSRICCFHVVWVVAIPSFQTNHGYWRSLVFGVYSDSLTVHVKSILNLPFAENISTCAHVVGKKNWVFRC